MRRLAFVLLGVFVAAVGLSGNALAKSRPDRTQFNRDIRVESGEKTGDVTCFNCSSYIRGEVSGDATAFHGRIVVETDASVAGDVTSFLGDVRVEPSSKVAGDLTVFGGALHRDTGAAVAGDVTSFENKTWVFLILLIPLVLVGLIIALIVWLVQRSRGTVPVTA
jgi:hypothetical protein